MSDVVCRMRRLGGPDTLMFVGSGHAMFTGWAAAGRKSCDANSMYLRKADPPLDEPDPCHSAAEDEPASGQNRTLAG